MVHNNQNKTEFLFESDAEKAVLREAAKPKKPKIYKSILINTGIFSVLIIAVFFSISYYEQMELSKIKASVITKENISENNYEKLYKNSDSLEKYNNNYKKKYEIIVNKSNPITKEFISKYTFVEVKDNLFKGVKLEEETYKNYLSLKENLEEKGYYINIRSGFRTFESSKLIYDNTVLEKGESYANNYVAKPGESEHNLGLSFDFTLSNKKNVTKTNYNSDEYFYLENIAYLYGFIIRYPKDKEKITGYSYEPWHLRYVGKNLAKYLKKNNLTLEEYYENKN